MEFQEFARQVNESVAAATSVERFEQPNASTATWRSGGREAEMELVPPQNFRLTLRKPKDEPASVRWYPVDENIVGLASQKIREYLTAS